MTDRSDLISALLALLRPVARFCLRRGLSLQDLISAAKRALVEVAEEEMRRSGSKPSSSRISVSTGVHRTDVTNLLRTAGQKASAPQNLLGRVLTQWENDPHFSTKRKGPRTLTFEGEHSEFSALVNSVTKTLSPGTLLAELLRTGAAQKIGNKLQLKSRGLNLSGNLVKAFEFASRDIDVLVAAVEENISSPQHLGSLHIRTEFDNVYVSAVDKVRHWLVEEGKEFHRRARAFLSEFDADINPSNQPEPAGVKVALTAFGTIDSSVSNGQLDSVASVD